MIHFETYYHYWTLPFWGFFPLVALAGLFLAVLVVWSLAWKAIALWHAARSGHKGWFIALFVINTAGILEILYIYIFSKRMKK